MWKEIKKGLLWLIGLFLLSCFVAFALAASILLLPVAMIIVAVLAIKGMITGRKRPEIVYATRRVVKVCDPFEEGEDASPIREIFSQFKEQVSYRRRQNKWSF